MNELILNNLNLVHFVIKKMNIKIGNDFDYDDLYQVGVIGLIYASKNYDENKHITFSTFSFVCIKNEILKFIYKGSYNDSLQVEICDDAVLEDTIRDENVNIEEKIIFNENNQELHYILNNYLNESERKIIKMLYGIDSKVYKQNEISEILNIPQYKVSRIKIRLLKRIKDCINNQKF